MVTGTANDVPKGNGGNMTGDRRRRRKFIQGLTP